MSLGGGLPYRASAPFDSSDPTARLARMGDMRAWTEADVQALLFGECRDEGLFVTLEYRIGNCRADLALIGPDDAPVALVEVKRDATFRSNPRRRPRQWHRYEATGLPWRYCRGVAEINDTVVWLVEKLYGY